MLGMLVAAFVAGSFIASPELRAYAANTVFSTDIVDGQVMTVDLANNAVTAAKVKDGEIKAAEIATDAVGAAEIQGVTKLLFGQCVPMDAQKNMILAAGAQIPVTCKITGVDVDDSASATLNRASGCFEVAQTLPSINQVFVYVRNDCSATAALGESATIAVIVYDK